VGPRLTGRKFFHEHQIPVSEALRMLKASNPLFLLREGETAHLRTQSDA